MPTNRCYQSGDRVSPKGPLGPGVAANAAFIVEFRARFQDFLIKRCLDVGRNHAVIPHPIAFQRGDLLFVLHFGILFHHFLIHVEGRYFGRLQKNTRKHNDSQYDNGVVIHALGPEARHLENEAPVNGNPHSDQDHQAENIPEEKKGVERRIVPGEDGFGNMLFKGMKQQQEHKTDVYEHVHQPARKILF